MAREGGALRRSGHFTLSSVRPSSIASTFSSLAHHSAEIFGRAGIVRLVLDTNTAISGPLWGGAPGCLIEAAEQRRAELASSTALLAELQGVLSRSRFAAQLAKRGMRVADLFDGYAALAVCVSPVTTPRVVERDPDDDHVIAYAIAAHADAIVSGDRDLLDLGQHQQNAILSAQQALARIAQGLSARRQRSARFAAGASRALTAVIITP